MQTSPTNPWNQLTLLPCCSKTWCLLHWLLRKSRSCPIEKIHHPLGEQHLLAQHLCHQRVYCCGSGGCAGPPGPVKPESKNPGDIPNVAAVLPLCPLFPGLDWLPGNPTGVLGKTAGVVPGEKLSLSCLPMDDRRCSCMNSTLISWRPFLQEHWPHFLGSHCCLAPYLTSSQIKSLKISSKTFSTVQCGASNLGWLLRGRTSSLMMRRSMHWFCSSFGYCLIFKPGWA